MSGLKFSRKRPLSGIRGVHLDLKGLPPSPERLCGLLDIVAAAGMNCVLVEWEDMYPWRRYPELRGPAAYSGAVVDRFLSRAQRLSLEVIPLVQSLGHLETVLSKSRFMNLRELQDNVAELCPCKPGSRELVISLIDDVLETHSGRIRHFHLGGDEAWFFASCPRCSDKAAAEGKAALYMEHMAPLLEHADRRGVRPLLWDDMMRRWPLRELRKLADRADLMVWSYRPEVPESVEKAVGRFARAGLTLWGASAFKGADGMMSDVPDVGRRKDNILAWMRLSRRYRLKGVVATGWSRYNSFSPPCESIEASLDSLVLSAWAMWDGRLPASARGMVAAFLAGGGMKRFGGGRFTGCRQAAEELQRWREEALDMLKSRWMRSAHIYGETCRRNPHKDAAVAREIRECLARGGQLAGRWRREHEGLVPGVWLDCYVKSRLWQVEKYSAPLLEALEGGQ